MAPLLRGERQEGKGEHLMTFVVIAAGLAAVVLLTAYICFRMAFYVPDKSRPDPEEIQVPDGSIYVPYHSQMRQWAKEMRAMPQRHVYITSHDGLKLHARFFEYAPGAVVEIMFHGYRGTAERDLSGGVQRCFSLGRSVLLVDQRGAGESEGRVISFGSNESRDCRAWVDWLIRDQGEDVKIVLTGISMGAATVMIAAGRPLPPQVLGVIADCGFSSAREIIFEVMRGMHLPPRMFYPFVKLGARLFGHFDLEETTAAESMKNCRLPVFFIHGEDDRFVPCSMSRQCYENCAGPKYLFTVPEAGHGMGYLMDTDGYRRALTKFSRENNIPIENYWE